MFTLIDGDPGEGKSQMTLSLAAALSNGRRPLDTRRTAHEKVLVYSAEDALDETLIPRLIAAGANLDNIYTRKGHFTFTDTEGGHGLALLDNDLAEVRPALVIIDPMVAYLGAGVDMYRANEVREFTTGLAERAEKHKAAIVAVRHLRKQGSGKDIYKAGGSIDFTGAARSELLLEHSKDGIPVVRHIKCNVGPLGPTLAYKLVNVEIAGEEGRPVETSRFEWLGPHEEADGVEVTRRTLRKGEQAHVYLLETLKNGPRPAQELLDGAAVRGIKEKTLRNAMGGVARSFKVGKSWVWELCPEGERDAMPLAA